MKMLLDRHLRLRSRTNLAIVALCAVSICGAGAVVIQQIRIASALSVIGSRSNTPPPALPLNSPAKALLANALAIGRSLPDNPLSPQQRAAANAASLEITTVLSRHPNWGEAWAAAAFLWAKRDGPWASAPRIALERSYLLSPYLRQTAGWRTAYGFATWNLLSESSRLHLVDEAVWLGRIDANARNVVFPLARASDGYTPFMLEWVRSREGDIDFQSPQSPPP